MVKETIESRGGRRKTGDASDHRRKERLEFDDLSSFLRHCRERMNPAAYGLDAGVRRTPGLRREEVAQRAHASVTWYTWLEQRRSGIPSADMLDRLARALDLNVEERQHLFLLAQQRPPAFEHRAMRASIEKLQAVLDAFDATAAIIRNHRCDVLAWNAAASAVLADYAALPVERRNLLDIMFCTPEPRERLPEWEADARGILAAFRHDVARVGANDDVQPLIAGLASRSADFRRFWDEGAVASLAEGRKVLVLPAVGRVALDYNAFIVEGAPHLTMVVYNPVGETDRAGLRSAIGMRAAGTSA